MCELWSSNCVTLLLILFLQPPPFLCLLPWLLIQVLPQLLPIVNWHQGSHLPCSEDLSCFGLLVWCSLPWRKRASYQLVASGSFTWTVSLETQVIFFEALRELRALNLQSKLPKFNSWWDKRSIHTTIFFLIFLQALFSNPNLFSSTRYKNEHLLAIAEGKNEWCL